MSFSLKNRLTHVDQIIILILPTSIYQVFSYKIFSACCTLIINLRIMVNFVTNSYHNIYFRLLCLVSIFDENEASLFENKQIFYLKYILKRLNSERLALCMQRYLFIISNFITLHSNKKSAYILLHISKLLFSSKQTVNANQVLIV